MDDVKGVVMMKRLIGLLVLVVALLAAVPAVLAGGWATVVLDELPGEIHAGESQSIGFMVLQHGKTPVHNLGADEWPVEPFLEATHAATGETVRVEAVPTEEVGHFVAEITFPSEGEWAWSITPMPFNTSTQEFEPLNRLARVAGSRSVGAVRRRQRGVCGSAGLSPLTLASWAGLASHYHRAGYYRVATTASVDLKAAPQTEA
jgi:hypothetical protein